jgi:hypothetical protein
MADIPSIDVLTRNLEKTGDRFAQRVNDFNATFTGSMKKEIKDWKPIELVNNDIPEAIGAPKSYADVTDLKSTESMFTLVGKSSGEELRVYNAQDYLGNKPTDNQRAMEMYSKLDRIWNADQLLDGAEKAVARGDRTASYFLLRAANKQLEKF